LKIAGHESVMSDAQETEILAKEAQLVYSNVPGWAMAQTLRQWRGTIENVEFEIMLPRLFPKVPPVVRALTKASHPEIDRDGVVKLRILDTWRTEYHLYQVILQLISMIKRSPQRGTSQTQTAVTNVSSPSSFPATARPVFPQPRPSAPDQEQFSPTISRADQQTASELASIRREIDRLRGEVTKKDEELTHMRAKEALSGSSTQTGYQYVKSDDLVGEIEAEQVAISELMSTLDDKHDAGDIDSLEYAKLFKRYSRDMYVLKQRLEYIRSKDQK